MRDNVFMYVGIKLISKLKYGVGVAVGVLEGDGETGGGHGGGVAGGSVILLSEAETRGRDGLRHC